MDLFKVYPLWDIDIVRAEGSYVWDDKGTRYLDMYGGHAVISIGHTHPHYVEKVVDQLKHIGFYSNSVIIDQQRELASKLGELSGKRDYQLFLCNSGAEANENAMKLASFVTGKSKVSRGKALFTAAPRWPSRRPTIRRSWPRSTGRTMSCSFLSTTRRRSRPLSRAGTFRR